ncbi:MAG TPA: alpha/beta hydrolase [Anaerolineales bacterium]|nr:alpha/beta hydrolase [Anaerolineales bacterium]
MTTLESSRTKHQGIVKKVYQAFFSPARYEVKQADREVIEWGKNYRIPFDEGELAVTAWGSNGPTVLLMHGWGGARAQMTSFVDPLLFSGYRIVAYDQPAHGDSGGKMTNLLEIAPTMDLIAQHEGPIHAIIAHSFGTLITSYALVQRNFPPPARLVYFGAFNQLLESLPRFQVQAGLSDEIMDGFREMLYEKFGRDVLESITNEILTPHIDIPALMFHDAADNVTPIEDSRAIARVWKYAQFIETERLGHRGALQSKSIHEQVVKFLKEEH